jgi:hypothetical protein
MLGNPIMCAILRIRWDIAEATITPGISNMDIYQTGQKDSKKDRSSHIFLHIASPAFLRLLPPASCGSLLIHHHPQSKF